MKALKLYMIRQFELRMVKHLRVRFPQETHDVSDEKIHERVRQGIDNANAYGIEYENDIRSFLEYSMIYGPNMDDNPEAAWIGEILRMENLDGRTKINLLDERDLQLLREKLNGPTKKTA
jgi:hypothetical protein